MQFDEWMKRQSMPVSLSGNADVVALMRMAFAAGSNPLPPSAEALLEELRQQGGSLQALAEAGLVAVKKGEDYNTGFGRDDYFPLGLASYAQMLWVKALRVVSFAKQPRPPNNEAVRDTLLDMVNYASFAADWLGRQQSLTTKKEG